ncbi:MAG: DUF2490 domain-containing protein [Bacteroidales bacterium]|nr:DUF2490 domain-containing protein [Bacteroidales bacterium]
MPFKTVRLLVFLVFPTGLLFSSPLMGQEKDAGLWTSVSFEAKLVKKAAFNISQEFRFNENITELGAAFTDAGLSYKLNKHFQFAVNYRFTQRHRVDDYYSFRHRFYADIKYSHKLKPFGISLRTRFQDQYSDIGRASDGGIPEYYLRNKLSLGLDLNKRYSPYISVELFSPLNYPRYNAFDNIRTTAGIEYAISKHHKIDISYMIQKEVNVSEPQMDFVLGLGYSYKL